MKDNHKLKLSGTEKDEAAPAEFIVRPCNYVHYPSGMVITENHVYQGQPPKNFEQFVTTIQATVAIAADRKPIIASTRVHIPAKNLTEAFKLLPDIVAEVSKKLITAAKQKLHGIVLPTPAAAAKFLNQELDPEIIRP